MSDLWSKFKKRIKGVSLKAGQQTVNVPESRSLSPCIIEPYLYNEGVKEENKAYIPVSLLTHALDDDNILNIAVAGNYGVGKSSVINTVERDVGKKHKFIKISLASLLTQEGKERNEGTDDKTPETTNHTSRTTGIPVSDKQIEYSILQQILYHDCPQASPKSRIQRIHKTRWYKPVLIALLCFLITVSLVILLKPKWYVSSEYYALIESASWVGDLYTWGPIVIILIAFMNISWYCSRHYSFSLSRIGYKNIEMKIAKEMSVFNAYMDEIVYFFESTKYDVVVFEDLDRFVNKDIIFYKLRELNTILNNCKYLGRKVNFVYAVLDHLFEATERVKFFDYIVTVIPVVNSLNSYNMLKKSIQPKELFDRLGGHELLNLCDYLQEMRLLLNIVNEFNHFSQLLDRSVMTDKILFGLVVYKNYVPSDFSKMYNKSGIVAGILDKADTFRDTIIKEKTQECELLRKSIEEIKEERDKKLYELRLQYLERGKALSNYPSIVQKIKIEDTPYVFESVAKVPLLFEMVREGKANYIAPGINTPITSFNTIELNYGGLGSFDKTETKINNEYESKVETLNRKLSSMSSEILHFPKTIEGIYQAKSELLDNDLTKLANIEIRELVKFLVLNGYFHRDYQYYISYFYPNSLKRVDRNFVMKAGRHEGPQYEVNLEAIDEVLKRFTPQNMAENHSLLNVDLTRAIFRESTYQKFRDPICQLIAKTSSVDFLIIAYKAEIPVNASFFFQTLRGYDYWAEIDERTRVDQDMLREIYIKFCDLREGKVNSHFKSWLIDNFSFLEKRWNIIGKERVSEVFRTCKPVFTRMIFKNTPEYVFNDILENNRYELTRSNLNAIVRRLEFYDIYKAAAYTSLLENGNQSLLMTIASNWSVFLKSIFPETSVSEDDAAQIAIANATLNSDSKYDARSYLAKQRNHINNVEMLQDEVLDFAYEYSLVAPTWQNVFYYSIKKGKGLPLQFMNKNIFHENVVESLSLDDERKLRRLVVFSDTLKLSKYKELVPFFNKPFDTVDKKIQTARMRYLVENKMITFNEENYKIVCKEYNLSNIFLVNNLDVFLSSPDKYTINSSDAVAAINSLGTKKAKCDFVRAIKNNVFIPTTDFISLIRLLIINGDIKVDEVSVQVLILVIAHAPIEIRLSLGRKAIMSLNLQKEEIMELLKAIGGEYKRLTTGTTISTLSNNRDSVMIINRLEKKGYIKGYEKKGDKLIVKK